MSGKAVALGVAALLVAGTAASHSDKTKNGRQASTAEKPPSKPCGFKATGRCTPHVKGSHRVRVDALIWHVTVTPVRALALGPITAHHGILLAVGIEVHSDRSETALVTPDVVKLVNGKNSYGADLEDSLVVAGRSSVANATSLVGGLQLEPDDRQTVFVVFDVPTSALDGKPELQFRELGFGGTKGYISVAHPHEL